jgi:hypothetical protein
MSGHLAHTTAVDEPLPNAWDDAEEWDPTPASHGAARAHNPDVAGSNPAPATTGGGASPSCYRLCYRAGASESDASAGAKLPWVRTFLAWPMGPTERAAFTPDA